MKKWVEPLARGGPGVAMVFMLLRGYTLFREPFGVDMITSVIGLLFISAVLYAIFVAVPNVMIDENKMDPKDVLLTFSVFIVGLIYWLAENANI